jgi:hypothetical protein
MLESERVSTSTSLMRVSMVLPVTVMATLPGFVSTSGASPLSVRCTSGVTL